MMTYVSFGVMALVLGSLFIRGVDLLIWESPPLFLGPFAKALALLKRAKCVMNVSDLWPESAVALGLVEPDSLATKMAERLELWLYRHSDAVTGQTEGIVAAIVERVPDVAVKLFPNGVDVRMFSPTPPDPQFVRRFDLEGKFVIGYGGIIGYAQALDQALDAAVLLNNQPDIVFALFGDGPLRRELIERSKQLGLKNLRFLPRQNRSDMPKVISLWNVGLVPLADHPLFAGARPSKMFELMGMAKPMIFCGKGEGAAIIENSGCGLVVPPEQPRRLADAIRRLRTAPEELNRMSQRARKLAVEEFDRSQIATRVCQFLQSLI